MKTKSKPLPKAPDEPHYLIIHNPYPRPHGMREERWDNASRRMVCEWLACFVSPPESILCIYSRKKPNNIMLVELAHTVDLSKVLGGHYWCTFDSRIPLENTEKTGIYRCKYETYEEAVTHPGWEAGAIDSAFLNNLKPLPYLKHVVYPRPRPLKLIDCFGHGDPAYARENPPPPEGAPPDPPLAEPQYDRPPQQQQRPAQRQQFRDPRYKDFPPFVDPNEGAARMHTPSFPERTTPLVNAGSSNEDMQPGAWLAGNATPAYSIPGTPGNMTPAYMSPPNATPRTSDHGRVPLAFPDPTPPNIFASTSASSSNAPSTQAAANTARSTTNMPPPPPPSTLNRNTADLRSRNAGPASRDPRLRAQATGNSAAATSSTSNPPLASPITPSTPSVQTPPPAPPYTPPSAEDRRSPTPYTRPPSSSAMFAQSISTISGGIFGLPGGVPPMTPISPTPAADGRDECASPAPDRVRSVQRGSTITSSFPTPPPEPVKIEPLQELELDVEMDIKPILLPNGDAVDARTLTPAELEQLREACKPRTNDTIPSQKIETVKMERVKKEEPADVPLSFESGPSQPTADPSMPANPGPGVAPTKLEYLDGPLDYPREHPAPFDRDSSIPGNGGFDGYLHQPATDHPEAHNATLKSDTDTKFDITADVVLDLKPDIKPDVKPDLTPDIKSDPALLDSGPDSWVLVHWDLVPDKAWRTEEEREKRLAWLRDENSGGYRMMWDQNVEVTFELADVEGVYDQQQKYKDEGDCNEDAVLGAADLEAEVDNFLDDLAFDMGMQSKRKREDDMDVDTVGSKRLRSESISMASDPGSQALHA
ncbi:hypothetical protein CALCODRAFT_514889 [Calocera cornea HHB12733]|uniref:Uncharacterized protein n=1 Tax=Calocera cornea HHB12733 TaxID=1353952 RepID=A0A165IYB3_9BASI|nr:hypothetical protein CALCODRAFT_514889 [Calocera cornea HHB12733]